MIATVENMRLAEKSGERVMAWSPLTGEEYSATPGDYFWAEPDFVLTDELGKPLILATVFSGHRVFEVAQ